MKNMSLVVASKPGSSGPTPRRSNRLVLSAACAAFALAMGGCDDDDDTLPRDASADTRSDALGGDTGDGPPAAGMCKGGFSSVNRAQLGAATSPTGMCATPGDLDIICNNDVAMKTRDCGSGCLVTVTAADPAAFLVCVSNCVALAHPLTAGCLGCYTQSVSCTLSKCLGPCAADPSSTACMTCQATNNCLSAFFSCSGLPSGQPPADGGAGDGGADGGADGGTDGSTTDAAAVDAPPADASVDMTPVDAPVDATVG